MENFESLDREVLERIAAGDENAFYQFYEEYRPQLRSFALEFTGSEADADDILQDTFIKIWLHRDKLPDLDKPRSWVYTVNARVCLNFMRTKVSRLKKMSGMPQPESEELTPFETTNLAQLQQLITRAVSAMPAQRQRIFRMSRDEGRKPSEIAELLGLTGGTVRNVLVKALQEIRSGLKEAGYSLDGLALLILLELCRESL